MLKNTFAAAIALAAVSLSTPAAAQNVTADISQIAEVFRGEGLQAKVENEEDGRPYIVSGVSGYTFIVRPYGCNDEWKECKFVQFRAAFAPDNKLTIAEVNKFAAENFFGRFYVDEENDPVVEMDLDLEVGGMSKELFVDNVAYWDMILSKFGEYAFSKDD